MIIETYFELGFTATEVMLGVVILCQCCFVYDALFAALSFQRAAGFDPEVARWCGVAEVGFTF